MRIAVIDDEPNVHETLDSYFATLKKEANIAFTIRHFKTAEAFLHDFSCQYDVLFLDIQMPGMNGFSLSQQIRQMDANVTMIFITNIAQYAIKGYEVEAFDYILKPISYPRFSTLMQKLAARFGSREETRTISLSVGGKVHRIEPNRITYIEVEGHRITIHLKQDKEVVSWGTLKQIEEMLTEDYFAKCKSCYLINLNCIDYIDGMEVHLIDGGVTFISQSLRKPFMKRVAEFLGGA